MPPIWYIYFAPACSHAKPRPKDKFVAIVCRAERPMGFFINTNVHPYVQNSPELLACQIPIKKSNYGFLSHDSYLSCHRLFSFEDSQLTNRRQVITQQTKREIQKVIANFKGIELRYQKLILGT